MSYCATCDGAFYQESEVAVVGNNLEAIEEAQFLTKFASTVHWVTATDPKPNDMHAKQLLAVPPLHLAHEAWHAAHRPLATYVPLGHVPVHWPRSTRSTGSVELR